MLPSYYFETMAIRIFSGSPKIDSYPSAIQRFFSNRWQFQLPCPDPKGLGPNLDTDIDDVTKTSVLNAMLSAAAHSQLAVENEAKGNIRDAYYWWQHVFGSAFPKYEGC